MRNFTQSYIFKQMNTGNSILNRMTEALSSLDSKTILNDFLVSNGSLDDMGRAYKETYIPKVIEAVKKGEIICVQLPPDRRFAANIPYVRSKRNGVPVVVVDLSKYAVVQRDGKDYRANIVSAKCDVTKLYTMLLPAYFSLKVFSKDDLLLSTEVLKNLGFLWAKMFCKILTAQKVFVGNKDKQDAFMYFAVKFFLIYYVQANEAIVEKISMDLIHNHKSMYLTTVETNIKAKGIDLYSEWDVFARTMFSNEITNVTLAGGEMTVEFFIKLFCAYLGRDGSFLALWSVDYFIWCLINAYNKSYILSDRSWQDIVEYDKRIIPKVIQALYNEV